MKACPIVCAVLAGALLWTYLAPGEAQEHDDAGAEWADSARTRAVELARALQVVANLEDALADSTEAWTARDSVLREGQRTAERSGREIANRLRATLDSVQTAQLDSVTAEHAREIQAAEDRAELWRKSSEAKDTIIAEQRRALLTAVQRGDEWESSAEEYRIASETKDAVIRSLKLQRNLGVLTVVGVAVAVVAVR